MKVQHVPILWFINLYLFFAGNRCGKSRIYGWGKFWIWRVWERCWWRSWKWFRSRKWWPWRCRNVVCRVWDRTWITLLLLWCWKLKYCCFVISVVRNIFRGTCFCLRIYGTDVMVISEYWFTFMVCNGCLTMFEFYVMLWIVLCNCMDFCFWFILNYSDLVISRYSNISVLWIVPRKCPEIRPLLTNFFVKSYPEIRPSTSQIWPTAWFKVTQKSDQLQEIRVGYVWSENKQHFWPIY